MLFFSIFIELLRFTGNLLSMRSDTPLDDFPDHFTGQRLVRTGGA